MTFIVDISYDVENFDWNDVLSTNKFSTAFQVSDWYKPHQLAFNSKPIFITVLNSTGKIVGQLSAVIHFRDYWIESNFLSRIINSKFNLGSTLRWFYGPIIHDMENASEIISNILIAIDKIALENNVNLIRGSSPPQTPQQPIDIYEKNGYSIEPWITHITNLERNVDELYSTLHNKTRYDVRKGEKNRLDFEVVSKRESFDLYNDVKYNDKNKIAKMKKLNKSIDDFVWNTTYRDGYEKMFLARYDGNPIGVIVNVLFNHNVVQMGVGNSPSKEFYGGSFLTWNTMKWSLEMGYSTYDVGGANPSPISQKEKGINLFKSKWASEKYDYFYCTKIFNKSKLKLSNIIKQPNIIPQKINKFIKK
jgi:hypothetical protein